MRWLRPADPGKTSMAMLCIEVCHEDLELTALFQFVERGSFTHVNTLAVLSLTH